MDHFGLDRTRPMKNPMIELSCSRWLFGILVYAMPSLAVAAEPAVKPLSIPKALVVVGPWGDTFRLA